MKKYWSKRIKFLLCLIVLCYIVFEGIEYLEHWVWFNDRGVFSIALSWDDTAFDNFHSGKLNVDETGKVRFTSSGTYTDKEMTLPKDKLQQLLSVFRRKRVFCIIRKHSFFRRFNLFERVSDEPTYESIFLEIHKGKRNRRMQVAFYKDASRESELADLYKRILAILETHEEKREKVRD